MRRVVSVFLAVAGCSSEGSPAVPVDAAPPPADAAPPDATPADASFAPMSLAETGLYDDLAAGVLAPGVLEYDVNHDLWADGATKRRFVSLPEGAVIDSADMNFWRLPVGTRLWKEFSRDGVRVETRLLWKQGPTLEDWFAMSFAWNEAGDEALAAEQGVEDALGTPHDIPRAVDCKKCHARQPDFALGFSALQLDHDRGDVNLLTLVAGGRLSAPPPTATTPVFPLPGDEVDRAALGYLHGNCGTCHNEHSDVQDKTLIVFHLDVETLATVEETTTYRTTVGVEPLLPVGEGYTSVIEAGEPGASSAHFRMSLRDPLRDSEFPMPPLASEAVDTDGLAAVTAWIESLGR